VEARADWLIDVVATCDGHLGVRQAAGLIPLLCILEAWSLYGRKQLLVSFGQEKTGFRI
jgi:hypothetical protein